MRSAIPVTPSNAPHLRGALAFVASVSTGSLPPNRRAAELSWSPDALALPARLDFLDKVPVLDLVPLPRRAPGAGAAAPPPRRRATGAGYGPRVARGCAATGAGRPACLCAHHLDCTTLGDFDIKAADHASKNCTEYDVKV
eukprot:CAMPEP_0179112470 /NCGR_PEP_ID=MMETSP0796-20121207/52575_1 /TAXON_ID=73915 /ORGANISM="Pyrodinium bahamense, Strain pbaha01" /LENGTH=140 /DNA_ID=CAMNT_0020810639 /DNA_START=101 /DNA_END=525 /DNA_ORIENTATION=-